MPLPEFLPGAPVTVHFAGTPTVAPVAAFCEVTLPASSFRNTPGFRSRSGIRALFEDLNIQLVGLFRYEDPTAPAPVFVGVCDATGRWFNLRRRELVIAARQFGPPS